MNRRGLLCGFFIAPAAPLIALLPKTKPIHDGNLITWEGIKSKIGDPIRRYYRVTEHKNDEGKSIGFNVEQLS